MTGHDVFNVPVRPAVQVVPPATATAPGTEQPMGPLKVAGIVLLALVLLIVVLQLL